MDKWRTSFSMETFAFSKEFFDMRIARAGTAILARHLTDSRVSNVSDDVGDTPAEGGTESFTRLIVT
jgi:hypothetical protein